MKMEQLTTEWKIAQEEIKKETKDCGIERRWKYKVPKLVEHKEGGQDQSSEW